MINRVKEFTTTEELNFWLGSGITSMEAEGRKIEIKKIFRSADKVYFVWWVEIE